VFCSCTSMWGHRVRLRSPQNVVDEIENIIGTYSIRRFGFVDDTFTIVGNHTRGICEEILTRGLDIEWACNVRVDTLTEDLVQLMKRAGCARFFMGVESGNQKTLDFVKKKTTITQIEKAVKIARKYSIEVVISCILGFPNETYTDTERTIDFAISLEGDRYFFNFLLLYPGTELYEHQKELKIKYTVDNPWERVEKTPFPIPTVETEHLNIYELSRLYLRAKAKLECLERERKVSAVK
jgi:anaerobic magnesium-protoporphyrin IX monomethyl ester cyclase